LFKEGQIPAISARVCALTQDHSGTFKILLKFIYFFCTICYFQEILLVTD